VRGDASSTIDWMTRLTRLCAIAALATCNAAADAADAHVHGTATLHVAVEGERLTLDFASPLESLVGFERAPRNDREKAAVQRMNDRVREPERLFVPTPEAKCTRTSAKVDQNTKDGHGSLTAEIEFRCERPQDLRGLDVKAFEAFPSLMRLNVRVAGAKRQSAAALSARDPRVRW
jgi:hypothetical protein